MPCRPFSSTGGVLNSVPPSPRSGLISIIRICRISNMSRREYGNPPARITWRPSPIRRPERPGAGDRGDLVLDPASLQPARTGPAHALRGASPRFAPRGADPSCFDCAEVDVADERAAVRQRLHWHGQESPANQAAVPPMPAIEEPGALVLGLAHRLGELSHRTAHERVEVRREDAPRVDLEPSLVDLAHGAGEEEANVDAVLEERAPCNRSLDDVMPRARGVLTGANGHAGVMTGPGGRGGGEMGRNRAVRDAAWSVACERVDLRLVVALHRVRAPDRIPIP